ncbi:E3 ubiquitin-protein ligase TRIM71-like [Clytia hemisphaerica]|uniref:Uncharacterized protein n=1 Tax=Clytia hemisphaerica TaxID=252671 RepID=A0A7M5XEC4_9CNID
MDLMKDIQPITSSDQIQHSSFDEDSNNLHNEAIKNMPNNPTARFTFPKIDVSNKASPKIDEFASSNPFAGKNQEDSFELSASHSTISETESVSGAPSPGPPSAPPSSLGRSLITIKEARDVYDLQCPICKLNYKNPKVLPCLHSFCHACLEDTINEVERSFNCPVCRLVIPIPTKGAEAFPLNSFATNMLNILAIESPHNCTNCEDRELASARCLDCVENLCENCVTAHERIRQTKSHRIVSFEELQNNTVDESIRCPSFCKIHDREILKYFCESCDSAICRDCAIFEHREHNYLDLKEAVKSHGKQLLQLLGNTKQKVPILKNALDSILQVENNLQQRKEKIEESINQSVDSHIQLLEEKRKYLLQQAQDMTSAKDNVLQEQFKRLHFDLDNVVSSCEFVDNIVLYGNEAEFMDVKYFMLSRLHALSEHKMQLVPEENDVLCFNQNNQNLMTGTRDFGILTTSQAFAPFCFASERNEILIKTGYLSSFQVVLNNRKSERITNGGDDVSAAMINTEGERIPVDVIDNQNGSYTIKYKVNAKTDHFLQVTLRGRPIHGSPFTISVSTGIDSLRIGPVLTWFGSNGVESNGKINEAYEPWGICCNSRDQVIVTDHNNHKIQIFDQNGKLLRQFGSRGKNDGEIWYPTGICVDKNDDIFVADHGNHRIQVFTPEGRFVRKIGGRGNMDGLFKGPCDIAIDLQNRLIVADRDNHRLQVLTVDGKFLFNIGSYGNSEGKFDSPRHVTITNGNHIIVSDSNNGRVQRFDENGQHLGILGKKGSNAGQFQCPAGLCTDTEDNLVVADFKNLDVQLFDKMGVFVKKIGEGVFSKPTSLCVTTSGNIFVADRGNHKIYLF